jgi:PLP dependent protein
VEVAAGLSRVRERIAAACSRSGRDPASVRLIAVSKTKPVGMLREAVAAGQTVFGENYAQELKEKADALASGVEWHFIGALQTNKAKLVVGRAALIHTCDRLALAQELSKRAKAAGLVQRLLVEVNVGREEQKAGILPENVPALLEQVRALPALACEGLMCIPPAEGDPRPCFRLLQQLGKAHGLSQLSMGMSADYEAAIEEGATLVRVGTAIFGDRPLPPRGPVDM